MARARILVVDDSPAMRETLCVLLGSSFDVRAVAPADLQQSPDAGDKSDLVIAAATVGNAVALPACPVIWLGGEGEHGLSRRFTPTELRHRVAAEIGAADAASQPSPSARPWWLREPFLDAASRSIVERARATRLALHIVGDPGSGKHAVARSILPGGHVSVCDASSPVPPQTTHQGLAVLAIGVDRWPESAQRALDDFLATAPAATVVSTATRDLAELRDAGTFLPDLYYRLTLLTVRLLPLRDRPADIPAIADSLAADIAQRIGRPVPTFSAAAARRLSNYIWFGNVAELQAVLTRTLALTPSSHIDVEDLNFDGTAPVATETFRAAAPESGAAPTDTAATTGPEADTDSIDELDARIDALAAAAANGAAARPSADFGLDVADKDPDQTKVATGDPSSSSEAPNGLDMIIHELAHEFKNPLVAIKSYAQHQQRTLPDDDPDEIHFAQVTEQAAEQIDQVLENLLTFTRMTEPQPQVVALDRLLAPLFSNGSGARFDYIAPPPVLVRVDPDQVSYAIDNLLRALLRDTAPAAQMTAQFCAPDALLCQLPAGPGSTSDKLRDLVGDDASAGDAMPLGIALASALLERNGAELRMTREGDPKTVMIRFPLVENEEEVEARNGTSPRIGR